MRSSSSSAACCDESRHPPSLFTPVTIRFGRVTDCPTTNAEGRNRRFGLRACSAPLLFEISVCLCINRFWVKTPLASLPVDVPSETQVAASRRGVRRLHSACALSQREWAPAHSRCEWLQGKRGHHLPASATATPSSLSTAVTSPHLDAPQAFPHVIKKVNLKRKQQQSRLESMID
jgi:hypothetical protein